MRVLLIFSILLVAGKANAQDTVKVMAYNILNYFDTSEDSAARNPHFRTVITATMPDILATTEIENNSTSQNFLNLVMKQVNPLYERAPFVSGYDTNSSLYFLSSKFSCTSNDAIETTLRDINHYTVTYLQTGDTLHVFVVHLKSSTGTDNVAQRLSEVNVLRDVTNLLPEGAAYIVCGDFNFYKFSEDGYQRLLEVETGGTGHFIDPLTLTGTWNNEDYAPYHTQSPRVRSFGGGVTGGMDDRFDMILYSPSIATDGDIQYLDGSTTAFGNDGQHYNDSINSPPNLAVSMDVANALHYAADHIPVIAKFIFVNGSPIAVQEVKQDINSPYLIYPNPAHDRFSMTSQSSMITAYTLYHMTGQAVLSGSFIRSAIIETADLPRGVYLVRFSNGKEIVSQRIVIE